MRAPRIEDQICKHSARRAAETDVFQRRATPLLISNGSTLMIVAEKDEILILSWHHVNKNRVLLKHRKFVKSLLTDKK